LQSGFRIAITSSQRQKNCNLADRFTLRTLDGYKPERDQQEHLIIDDRTCSGDDLEDQELLEGLVDDQRHGWKQQR
jgi:hypothetical protein